MADYTVKAGDTLAKIAKANNTTVQNLCELNGIKNPNQINVGQELSLGKTNEGQPAQTEAKPSLEEQLATMQEQIAAMEKEKADMRAELEAARRAAGEVTLGQAFDNSVDALKEDAIEAWEDVKDGAEIVWDKTKEVARKTPSFLDKVFDGAVKGVEVVVTAPYKAVGWLAEKATQGIEAVSKWIRGWF